MPPSIQRDTICYECVPIASSSDASECSEAVETYTAAVGCCVYYWRGGVGERSDGRPSLEDFFVVKIPDACAGFSPPKEFLDCACDENGAASARSSFSERAVLFSLVIAVYELLRGL